MTKEHDVIEKKQVRDFSCLIFYWGRNRLATAIGMKPNAVGMMGRRNNIQSDYWPTIIAASTSDDSKIRPEREFAFAIDWEFLHHLSLIRKKTPIEDADKSKWPASPEKEAIDNQSAVPR